ncbi:hypothetical protein LG047_10935 [Methylocystis sp. WRRC1]|uniref:hypothetical protein n=1 Tax=Methylocystis sp. WRRC1 TaxID=1732014 RepID=UPI001D140C97|nr:hypothetical protein [Methylocystis sp. WRRC1]MCC3245838.1 hypothetical protein [Methylocystis sp. WRRC1]
MADEPESLVLQLLRQLRDDVADTQSQIHSLRADVASDLVAMQAKNDAEHRATREQIVGLRRAVVEYHSAVLGHGMLISDLEARVRRLEQKVGVSDA